MLGLLAVYPRHTKPHDLPLFDSLDKYGVLCGVGLWVRWRFQDMMDAVIDSYDVCESTADILG